MIELENEFIHQIEYFIDFYIWTTGEIGGDIGGRDPAGKTAHARIIKSLIPIIFYFFYWTKINSNNTKGLKLKLEAWMSNPSNVSGKHARSCKKGNVCNVVGKKMFVFPFLIGKVIFTG